MQALIGTAASALSYAGLSRQSSTAGDDATTAQQPEGDEAGSEALVRRAPSKEDAERHQALTLAAQQLVVADPRPLLLPQNVATLITAASLAARVSMCVASPSAR